MGGLLHIIDFDQGSMARKVTHQRHGGGLEAPRNSLELPVETSQSYYAVGDNVPYTYQMEDWSENCYLAEAPIKKLIGQEISKRSNIRHNAPSVVARLMGVDMLPIDTKPATQQVEKKNGNPRTNFKKEDRTKNGSVGYVPFTSYSSREIKPDTFRHNEDRDTDRWGGSMKISKPRPREHPQEEELQKFKKEFEAWQAARFKECSKVARLSINSEWIAQENLNKEKMVLYANSRKITARENPTEPECHAVKASQHVTGGLEHHGYKHVHKGHSIKSIQHERGGSQHHGYKNEPLPAELKESFSRSRTPSTDFEQSLFMNSDKKLDVSSAPTRIVILRPGPDRIGNNGESWASSSGTSERGSIEDFLEEVKERLKSELQGKTYKRGSMVRGGGIETPYSEKPSDPKQIAQRIANQVRESVTRDLGMNLLRSESTRSSRSEIQLNGAGSPEFISRDTRRFLSERLRNVLKAETHSDIPMAVQVDSRSSMLENRMGTLKSGNCFNARDNICYWDRMKDEPDIQSRSFRRGSDDDVMHHNDLSPGNLIRSLSAPVSGTSFGKLLLEDRHILTGAHIRRKHEAIEKVTVNVKKRMKEKVSFREKVSSFKYSFTLRRRLFGRKIQSAEELHSNRHDVMKDILSGPTVMMNFSDRHENFTEVPPSPASVCSSVHEELWRPTDYFRQTSISDVPPLEDNAMPQVFREISSNLIDLRRQLNELEIDNSEEKTFEDQPLEAEMVELEDQVEVYIRDLLVASGLYDGATDKSLSRWDLLGKPISNLVFEKVEESYRKKNKDNEGEKKVVDHKLLLDLLNEALSTVLGPSMTMSRFMKKAIDPMRRPPRGMKLLDRVWEIICEYVYSPSDKPFYSLDGMVARDMLSALWSGSMDDDVNAVGKEIECQIFRDLIEEIIKDIES